MCAVVVVINDTHPSSCVLSRTTGRSPRTTILLSSSATFSSESTAMNKPVPVLVNSDFFPFFCCSFRFLFPPPSTPFFLILTPTALLFHFGGTVLNYLSAVERINLSAPATRIEDSDRNSTWLQFAPLCDID